MLSNEVLKECRKLYNPHNSIQALNEILATASEAKDNNFLEQFAALTTGIYISRYKYLEAIYHAGGVNKKVHNYNIEIFDKNLSKFYNKNMEKNTVLGVDYFESIKCLNNDEKEKRYLFGMMQMRLKSDIALSLVFNMDSIEISVYEKIMNSKGRMSSLDEATSVYSDELIGDYFDRLQSL